MGKKLTIYMLDGSPTGCLTIEIGNWSGKAIYAPRSQLKSILDRAEFENAGVYILKSETELAVYNDAVYIGEAEELRSRLKQQIADRDFESMICFFAKDELLTKAHVKFLESRLIALAKEANSSKVENSNQPKLTKLSEADISDMEYFIDQIRLILPTVGLLTLVPSVQTPTLPTPNAPTEPTIVYNIKSPTLKAVMIETIDGFVVQKDSEASLTTSESISEGWNKLRSKLISTGGLVVSCDRLVFTEDVVFSSPSAASSVVLGRQSAGPVCWLDGNGKTYRQAQQELEASPSTDT